MGLCFRMNLEIYLEIPRAGGIPRLSGLPRRRRIASIIMTGGHFATYVSGLHQPRYAQLLLNRKRLSVLEPVDRLVKQLNLFQPEALFRYTTMIELIAHRKLDGALRIRPLFLVDGGS